MSFYTWGFIVSSSGFSCPRQRLPTSGLERLSLSGEFVTAEDRSSCSASGDFTRFSFALIFFNNRILRGAYVAAPIFLFLNLLSLSWLNQELEMEEQWSRYYALPWTIVQALVHGRLQWTSTGPAVYFIFILSLLLASRILA